MKIPKTDNSLTKGLVLASDEITNRVYIKEAKPGSTARKMCKNKAEYENKFKGAFLVSIRNEPVFTREDALRLLAEAKTQVINHLVRGFVMLAEYHCFGSVASGLSDMTPVAALQAGQTY